MIKEARGFARIEFRCDLNLIKTQQRIMIVMREVLNMLHIMAKTGSV